MSQKLVYDIIEELGGSATCSEIRTRAKEKYPDLSLYAYVSNRLIKLCNWKIIERKSGGKLNGREDRYVIIDKFD